MTFMWRENKDERCISSVVLHRRVQMRSQDHGLEASLRCNQSRRTRLIMYYILDGFECSERKD